MSGRNVDPLVVGRVIGEVVDTFVARVKMCVQYGSKHVTNGCDIKPSFAALPPTITLTSGTSPNQFYTLVMTDPDAPSPSEPSMREWVHWIVTDIPGCTNLTQGKEVVSYLGPKPRLGIHRFVFILFEQKARMGNYYEEDDAELESLILSLSSTTSSRSNFSTRAFAHHFDLGLPVSAVFFNAHKEPKLHKIRL